MIRWVPAVAAFGLGLACARGVLGQDGMTKATAEALFADGKRLMTTGEFASACPKFAASQKLDPAVGTALNLADCYEKMGRTASAWAEFRGAASAARSVGSKEREQLAETRAKALENKLSYLTITTTAKLTPGAQLIRDGSVIDPAVIGTPIPIDPGRHDIEVVAGGKRKWSVEVDVSTTASRVTVSVPDLGDGLSTRGPSMPTSPAPDPARYSGAQRGVGIGVGVLGVMGVAAGTVFGLKASSDWSGAKSHCRSYPQGCDTVAVTLAQDARAAGNAATVAFVIGAVGLAGGAVIFFTAPKSPSTEKALGLEVRPTSVGLTYDF
jgi:hypothetical protein